MRRIIKMLKPFTTQLVWSLIFMLLSTVLQMVVPLVSKSLVQEILLIQPAKEPVTDVFAAMPYGVYKFGVLIILTSVISLILALANNYFSTVVSTEYSKALRGMMFRKVSGMSQSDIDRIGVSSLITRTTNDISNVHDVVLTTLRNALSVPILLVGGIVMVLVTAPNLAATILLIIPIFLLILVVFFKFIVPLFNKMQKKLDEINQILREKISGIRVIRAFNKTEQTDAKFRSTNFVLTSYSLKANRVMSLMYPVVVVIVYGIVVLLLYRVVAGVNSLDPADKLQAEQIMQTIPNLSAFLMYFMLVLTAIAQIVSIVGAYPRAAISARRINTVLDSVTDIVEPDEPTPIIDSDASVEFRDVSFVYKEKIVEKTRGGRAERRLAKLMGIEDPEDEKKSAKKQKKVEKLEKKAAAEAIREQKRQEKAEKKEPVPVKEEKKESSGLSDAMGAAPGNNFSGGGSAPAVLEPTYAVKKDVTDDVTKESRAALDKISFRCRSGETTAIIGGTGCGKSTVISLIPRLYDCTEGEVLIDGVNIKELSFNDLQKRIAYIPQKAFLFSGTIRENIKFGKEDATDEEIWRALEIAQAKSFVSQLPDGLDSRVSQAGANFSGGQRQRLAIARAVVKKAEIYIFDDSFSALDLATDARLRASIKTELSGANIIIVAQRIGTVMDADRIIVMDKGRIVDSGRHDELKERCELYSEIVSSQLHGDEEAIA